MARTKEFDERKALDAAMQLFWEKGYEATSLSALTERMGLQRSSFYATYGDKRSLFTTALQKYSETRIAYLKAKLQGHASVRESIKSCFKDIIDIAYQTNPSFGCFCVNTIVELAPHDSQFSQITSRYQEQLQILVWQALEKGILAGEFSRDLDALAVSHSLIIFMNGLLVTLKTKPERQFIDESLSVMFQLLK
ncbi:TetR/AcrR family transcriptional regulator [Paenibacillus sp. TAB 01]|uniref:TetR/AcrR family transcriptional regulator n=1 Tax=Paenibacillus sp. TAB 01 TaxID=3368988 RepID=UPI00375167B7